MNEPLVSVVIPTYNRPVYLKRCIESVLNQTYKNIELIVVDDNEPGTDARKETEQLMKDYQTIVIYLRHEQNMNGAAARNTGWRASKGEYITFLDDDDVIEKNKIECQVNCLNELDYTWGACYTAYRLIKENGDYQISSENSSGNCYLYALMRTMFMGSGSNLFLRKSVVDEIGGYDESFIRNQDIEFMARALENYKLAYIDKVLLTIYQEGNRPKRSFEQIDGYAKYYLTKFSDRIDKLSIKDAYKVKTVISLERARAALTSGEYKKMREILIENNVRILTICRYISYLIYRKVTKKSFGFHL